MEPTHRVTFATCHSHKFQQQIIQKEKLPNVEVSEPKNQWKDAICQHLTKPRSSHISALPSTSSVSTSPKPFSSSFPPKIPAFSPQLSPIWPLHTFCSLPHQEVKYLLLGVFLMARFLNLKMAFWGFLRLYKLW